MSVPDDSGYDHGCDDAGISDPSERYYNQPEKGPSFHTSHAFNRGYTDGFSACSSGNNESNDGSENDDGSGGRSIVGSYADGYELGKVNGRDDYRSGNSHDSKCPPWCTGYKVGYEAGWFIDG